MSILNIISKIRKGKIWDFHGGLHPDEHKRESSEAPLVNAGIPPFLVIPIKTTQWPHRAIIGESRRSCFNGSTVNRQRSPDGSAGTCQQFRCHHLD